MTDDRLVTAEELATWFGEISPSAVRAMAARGVIVKEARGRFPLKASVAAYCNQMRTVATGKGEGTASDERKRLARPGIDGQAPPACGTRDRVPESKTRARGLLRYRSNFHLPKGFRPA